MASLRGVHNVEDLRRLARRRLPRVVFDYVDGGADGEYTLGANRRAFEEVVFRPRGAVASASCDLRVGVLGDALDLPFALAPVGSARLLYPRGECVAAGAAGNAGTAYALSTLSGCRLEDVRAASRGPVWYQLYLAGGRDAARDAIRRAREAGFSALLVTVDTPVAGLRERDYRNGAHALATRRASAVLARAGQFVTRPGWLVRYFRDGGMMRFENVVVPGEGPMRYTDVAGALERSMVCWDDFGWIRDAWGSAPIAVKGILTAADARRAVDAGADAVIVSNHGGRQLDGVAAALRALPEVVAAVGSRAEVLLDGGVRRGGDVVKAICLGARAVLVGRAYAYGLGAAGGAGVARAIDILRADVERTLKLLGCSSVAALDGSYVDAPTGWTRG